MRTTKSTDVGSELAHFQCEQLTCLNCGDVDSRLVFVPADPTTLSPTAGQEPLLVAFEDTPWDQTVIAAEVGSVNVGVGRPPPVEEVIAAEGNQGSAEKAMSSENAAGHDAEETARIENTPSLLLESLAEPDIETPPAPVLTAGESFPEELSRGR